jgi:dienelactone hydrolase
MASAADVVVAIVAGLPLALTACSGVAVAQHRETVDVESRFHGKPLTVHAQVLLPDKHGGGKIPAMIVVHGSGGVRAVREFSYAREFNTLGVATIVIDSFTPRGIKSTVRDQSTISSYDMLVDAVSTLKAIARHPAIDPARIGIIGFSKGGTVAIKAALKRYIAPLAGNEASFALLIGMYPWCGDLPLDFQAANSAPMHMLLGADDRYVGLDSCREFGKRFAAAGGNLTLKVYPGAQHGWDTPGSTHWTEAAGQNSSKCIYDEVAPGTWVERGSQIKIAENNRPTATAKKATAHCMTLGVSGGYNAQVRAQSMQDVRGFVREAFKLQ